MKRPTWIEVQTAVEWLRVNDGVNGEDQACAAVANWLERLQRAYLCRNDRKALVMHPKTPPETR